MTEYREGFESGRRDAYEVILDYVECTKKVAEANLYPHQLKCVLKYLNDISDFALKKHSLTGVRTKSWFEI